jgi:AbrB family looped-hinge helix DNA binding protein
MKEYLGSVSTKGQITLPVEFRKHLGIKPGDKVALYIEDETLVVKTAQSGLRAGFMSIPALKTPMDVEEMTEIAAEEAANEFAGEALSQR